MRQCPAVCVCNYMLKRLSVDMQKACACVHVCVRVHVRIHTSLVIYYPYTCEKTKEMCIKIAINM